MTPKENQENSEENNKKQKSGITFESLDLSYKLDNFLIDKGISNFKDLNEDFLRKQRKDFLKANENIAKSFYDLDDTEKEKKIDELIQKKLEKKFIERNKIEKDLENIFIKSYHLDTKSIKLLNESIKNAKFEKLRTISLFKSLQEKFLVESGIYKKASEIVYKKDIEDNLSKIFGGIEHISFKSQSDKFKVLNLIKDFNSLNHISYEDLKALFSYLNNDQKNKLAKHFLSKISLKTLKENGLKTKQEISDTKQKIIENYKSKFKNLKLNQDDLDENNIFLDNNENIIFNDELESDLANIVTKEINKLKDETIKENYQNCILSKLEPKGDNENINDSFIDYINKNPLPGVEGIEKLQNKNYIVYETKKPDGTKHRIIQKIDEVDLGHSIESKAIKLTNLTSSYGVLSASNKTDVFFYDDFYNFLKTPSQAKENEEEVSIKFISESDYKKYLEENQVKEVSEEKGVKDLADLKTKIDIIDPSGLDKDITKALSTTFVVGKPGDKDYGHFSILAINEGSKEITLSSKDSKTGRNEKLSFDLFLEAFSAKEAKRGEYIGRKNNFIPAFLKMKEFEGKFELKDGDMIEKIENGEKPRKLEYLANSNGKAIKIEEWGNDYVSICTGELKEKDKKKKFTLSYPIRVSYEDFYNHINDVKGEKDEYKPVLEEKDKKPDEVQDPKRGFSIGKKLFSFYCVNDIISGLKMLPNLVEDYLKQGSSIRSAKLALALGKHLPDAVRLQLQAKVESEEKKAVEDLVGKWVGLDSSKFIPRIEKVIKDRASEDYEVEAAMISILKKYGKLYRGGMAKYNGSFIWYRAFGGTPNDALYLDFKADCEKNGIPFTEELLLEKLLKIQSSLPDDKNRTKYGIKKERRSKFGKDFGNYIKGGIKEELDDGKNKTDGMLSAKGVIDYALSEFGKLAHNNGIGAMENVWNLGGDVHLMNMIPHIITTTGLSLSLWTSTLSILSGKADNKPYPALAFCGNIEDIKIYRNVSKKLVEKMGLSNDDKALFYKSIDDSKSEVDRIAAAKSFYEKHGENLTKKLMINQDPVIFLEKDSDSDFKLYYDKISKSYSSNGYSIEKEGIEKGIYNYDSGLPFFTGGNGFLFKKYSINTEKKSAGNVETKILNSEIEKGFKDINNLKLDINQKKKIFEYYFKTTESLISGALQGKLNESKQDGKYPFLDKLRKSILIELYYDNREEGYQNTDGFKKLMENQWLKYKVKFIEKSFIEEKEESKFEKEKKVRLSIEDDVFKILKGEQKSSEIKKEKPKKEELDDEEIEEKEEECNNYMETLKKSKNGSSEQKKIVEKILNDELWSIPKKQGPGYISSHPFYKKKASGNLINGKIDNNNCTIILPAGKGSIIIKDGKITYTNGPKK